MCGAGLHMWRLGSRALRWLLFVLLWPLAFHVWQRWADAFGTPPSRVLWLLIDGLCCVYWKLFAYARGCVCFAATWDAAPGPSEIAFALQRDGSLVPRGPWLPSEVTRKRRLVFIRHGESMWNSVFNEPIVTSALLRGTALLVGEFSRWADQDSLVLDSPLSDAGIGQALTLAQLHPQGKQNQKPTKPIPQTKPAIASLSSQCQRPSLFAALNTPGIPKPRIVASNLRRAISTAALVFSAALRAPETKVHISSDLQEVTRNFDGNSLSGAHSAPPVPAKELSATLRVAHVYAHQLNLERQAGPKELTTSAQQRIYGFVFWLFDDAAHEAGVIAVGHSTWLCYFVRLLMPMGTTHHAQKAKLSNCGVLSVEILEVARKNGVEYMIDPQSVEILHGALQ